MATVVMYVEPLDLECCPHMRVHLFRACAKAKFPNRKLEDAVNSFQTQPLLQSEHDLSCPQHQPGSPGVHDTPAKWPRSGLLHQQTHYTMRCCGYLLVGGFSSLYKKL